MSPILPVPANANDEIKFTGDAVLLLKRNGRIPAKFVIASVDGIFPSIAELTLDPHFADFAYQHGPSIHLEIFGVKIKTPIATQNKQTKQLYIFAAPILRGLARAMEMPDRPYLPHGW